jgi:transcription elongation factor Elf1
MATEQQTEEAREMRNRHGDNPDSVTFEFTCPRTGEHTSTRLFSLKYISHAVARVNDDGVHEREVGAYVNCNSCGCEHLVMFDEWEEEG